MHLMSYINYRIRKTHISRYHVIADNDIYGTDSRGNMLDMAELVQMHNWRKMWDSWLGWTRSHENVEKLKRMKHLQKGKPLLKIRRYLLYWLHRRVYVNVIKYDTEWYTVSMELTNICWTFYHACIYNLPFPWHRPLIQSQCNTQGTDKTTPSKICKQVNRCIWSFILSSKLGQNSWGKIIMTNTNVSRYPVTADKLFIV